MRETERMIVTPKGYQYMRVMDVEQQIVDFLSYGLLDDAIFPFSEITPLYLTFKYLEGSTVELKNPNYQIKTSQA